MIQYKKTKNNYYKRLQYIIYMFQSLTPSCNCLIWFLTLSPPIKRTSLTKIKYISTKIIYNCPEILNDS